jgi:hypothetical protein
MMTASQAARAIHANIVMFENYESLQIEELHIGRFQA